MWTSTLSDSDVAGLYADGSALSTTTTVSTSPASPSAYDAPVTVSATVKDANNANPSGVAELWIDGTREGAQHTVTNGAVSFPAVTMSPRAHSVQVRFVAGGGWKDSSGTVTHTVSRPPVNSVVPIRYRFDENTGTSAATTGTTTSVGAGMLQGNAGWVGAAKYNAGLNLPGCRPREPAGQHHGGDDHGGLPLHLDPADGPAELDLARPDRQGHQRVPEHRGRTHSRGSGPCVRLSG